jgi:hypothetical protein
LEAGAAEVTGVVATVTEQEDLSCVVYVAYVAMVVVMTVYMPPPS